MLGKREFCECAEVMRSYAIWERGHDNWNICPICEMAFEED